MVKRNVMIRKIEAIDKHILIISQYQELSLAAFLENQQIQDVVAFNIFQAINSLISMMEHIVVDEAYGLPESAYHSAEILFKKKILIKKDVELMRQMVGFRNVIAHQYTEIDKCKIYGVLIRGMKDIKRIVRKLTVRFIK